MGKPTGCGAILRAKKEVTRSPVQKIYIVGHGKWVPLNGWIKVPAGVRITFYSNIYTVLQNTAVWELLEGKALGDIPPRTFTQSQWIENQTLSWHSMVHMSYYEDHAAKNPDEMVSGDAAKFLYIFKKNARTTLQEIFKDHEDQIINDGGWDVHWACCRAVVKEDQLAYDRGQAGGIVPLTRVKAGGVTELMAENVNVTGKHTPNSDVVTRISRPIVLP